MLLPPDNNKTGSAGNAKLFHLLNLHGSHFHISAFSCTLSFAADSDVSETATRMMTIIVLLELSTKIVVLCGKMKKAYHYD